jgi:hypothetical protein
MYEFLDEDSNQGKPQVQKKVVAPVTPAAPTKAAPASANRAPRSQDNRKPRDENRQYSDQQVTDRKPRGERQGKSAGDFQEVRAPRNPNQRQYDRKSGTGRGRENKRQGGGRGNWGVVTDEKAVDETEKTENTEAAPATDAAPAEASTEAVAATEAPVEQEEEEKSLTLDEYLSTVKKVNITLPPPRQAGEGQEADKKWSTYVALKKEDNEEKEEVRNFPEISKIFTVKLGQGRKESQGNQQSFC